MKKKVGYVVEEVIKDAFNDVARLNALNKSLWLENKMKEYIEENKRS